MSETVPPASNPPASNEWSIPEELLDATINHEIGAPTEVVDDNRLKWFQMIAAGGETETEKKETIEAQKEQLRLGILKLPPNTKAPVIPQQVQTSPVTRTKIDGTFIPADILNGISKPAQVQQQKKAKVGPNDPCVCGSKKKFKKCCMYKQHLK